MSWGTGVKQLRRLWQRITSDTSDDPLPMAIVGIAVAGSLAALVLGWLLGAWDFLINILASVALLGPGLIATNVLARNWRTRRRNEEILNRVEGPLSAAISVLEGSMNRLQRALPEPIRTDLERPTPIEVEEQLRERISTLTGRVRVLHAVCESMWTIDEITPMYPFALRRPQVKEILRILDELSGTVRTDLVAARLQEIHDLITVIQERDSSLYNLVRVLRCLIDALGFLAQEVPAGTSPRWTDVEALQRDAQERLWSADHGPHPAWAIKLHGTVFADGREHPRVTQPADVPKEGGALVLGPDLSTAAMTVLRRHGIVPDPNGWVAFHDRPEIRVELLDFLERHG
jgi:hypothetical protein